MPFSEPLISQNRMVVLSPSLRRPLGLISMVLRQLRPTASTYSIVAPVDWSIILPETRQSTSVTFGAVITTSPVIFRPLTTAPGVLMVMPPDGVRVTPARTPVVDALGNVAITP